MSRPSPALGPALVTASVAAAKVGLKPAFFISGIVKVPVMTMLAAPLPTIEPTMPLDTTAAFAAPPL